MILIDCKKIAQDKRDEVKLRVEKLKNKPTFCIISIGENDDNAVYMKHKQNDCSLVGIESSVQHFDSIEQHVANNRVSFESMANTATIVQLPISNNLDVEETINNIDCLSDADCLTALNLGKLYNGTARVFPATAKGIVDILESIGDSLVGKDVVVVGRSLIVGKPVAELLLQKDCTVTICHSKTKNLQSKMDTADIVIAAIGRAKHLVVNNPNAILIDVGINRDENGKLCGDFDLDRCVARAATPVPGGVGLITRACLLENIVTLAEIKEAKEF